MNTELAVLKSRLELIGQMDSVLELPEGLKSAVCFASCGKPHVRDFAIIHAKDHVSAASSPHSLSEKPWETLWGGA